MIKKITIFYCVFLLLLATSGCGRQEQVNTNQEQNQTNQSRELQVNPRVNWEENFDKLTLNDVVVGKKVMVMGSEDDNKIVTAQQIFVGDSETDFEQMGRGMFGTGPNGGQQVQNGGKAGFAQANTNQRQRPDFEI